MSAPCLSRGRICVVFAMLSWVLLLSSCDDEEITTQNDTANLPVGDTSTYMSGSDTATVSIARRESDTRTYTLSTTATLRDNEPASKQVTFSEQSGQMIVRSGHDIFDALFALAIEETRQNSVSQISDFAFNNGNGVPCECFETGAKWNYVWTRDTAYAVDLGLALVDPERSRNALDFKLSERKSGGNLQIVQDTGSGGSYPVSSDRVVWALGAWEVLKFLEGADRTAFRDRTYEALTNTIAHDRTRIFDARDGLYRGEQSFLDWREQSYPSWTADNTVHIGMSKALSTNVDHAILLEVAAALADEVGDHTNATQYQTWADDLKTAIRAEFWLDSEATLSAMKTTELDASAVHKLDLLGLSLAILRGIVSTSDAESVLSQYPHSKMGPPVLWPQQPGVPIYHNRGIWPFVTAYTLLAAKQSGHDAVFDHDLESLIRGAALNLSNMENFEFLTQVPWYDDGPYSGPVVNSRRQLWSVAGYVGAIVKGVFGLEVSQDGFRVSSYVTPRLHRDYFSNTSVIELKNVGYRGKVIDIEIFLPMEVGSGAAYDIDTVFLNGTSLGDVEITTAMLADQNTISVELIESNTAARSMTIVDNTSDLTQLRAPIEPSLNSVTQDAGGLRLDYDASGESNVTFRIYRDGSLVADDLPQTSWVDADATNVAGRSYCYAVESVFTSSGHASHHSTPVCYWGPNSERVRDVSVYHFRQVAGGDWAWTAGRPHYANWGAQNHVFELLFKPHWTGSYRLQLLYGNGAGGLTTGITASVKEVRIFELASGTEVASGTVLMPHLGTWDRWGESSLLQVEDLDADTTYRMTISDDVNMSYFAHFEPYTRGLGGGSDTYNFVNISHVRFLPISGTDETPSTGSLIPLDAVDDIAKFAAAQQITPGATLQAWDTFALTWDDDYLYISLTSEAFEQSYVPLHIYVESATGTLGSAVQGSGLEYSTLTPALPFTPTHVITARQLSDDGSAFGPWNGVMAFDGSSWQHVIRFEPNIDCWLASDNRTISLRVPRLALGEPDQIRLAAHVVNAIPANEWKDLLPSAHTPWSASANGYYEIDLNGATNVSSWTLR